MRFSSAQWDVAFQLLCILCQAGLQLWIKEERNIKWCWIQPWGKDLLEEELKMDGWMPWQVAHLWCVRADCLTSA